MVLLTDSSKEGRVKLRNGLKLASEKGKRSKREMLMIHRRSKGADYTSNADERFKRDELVELIQRFQDTRLEGQRCSLPRTLHNIPLQHGAREGPGKPPPPDDQEDDRTSSRNQIRDILTRQGPYPQVVIPLSGGYWVDGGEPDNHYEPHCDNHVTNQTISTTSDHNQNENHNHSYHHNMENGSDFSQNLESNHSNSSSKYKIETNETALTYRRHFMGKEHLNFYGEDDSSGPVVMSCRKETISSQERTQVILRQKSGTDAFPVSNSEATTPLQIAKKLRPELHLERLHPVTTPKASELLASFDEQELVKTFKFGVIYQKLGQITEEDLFCNSSNSPAFREFLELIGRRIKLKDHKEYRGGLDTVHGHTGEDSVYEVFQDKEIMFHVSTLLPYTENDTKQLERKRHIGNDIVAIVFQEDNTPFAPDLIASHFLHAYVVIQPINPCTNDTRYRVSVTARKDVPFFRPTLPSSGIFKKGSDFKEFLLTKLINAELACMKAERFARLQERTRSLLLIDLVKDLKQQTSNYLGMNEINEVAKSSKFIDIVKKVLDRPKVPVKANQPPITVINTIPVKKQVFDSISTSDGTPNSSRSKTSKDGSLLSNRTGAGTPTSSPDSTPHTRKALSESDNSSLNSIELDTHQTSNHEDSDTGLESMSSAETLHQKTMGSSHHKILTPQGSAGGQHRVILGSISDDVVLSGINDNTVLLTIDKLNEEVTKLKNDKYDLLRQNVTCQRDLKKLKEKEMRLICDLSNSTKEILRLQSLLKDLGSGQVSAV